MVTEQIVFFNLEVSEERLGNKKFIAIKASTYLKFYPTFLERNFLRNKINIFMNSHSIP